MKLSVFGEKLTAKTGILQLMDDLGNALSSGNMLMLGGGNPAHIPQMEKIWKIRMKAIMKNPGEFEKTLGDYTTPQGDAQFIEAITDYFKNSYGFKITNKNICVLGGSQTAFFFLFNMLAGKFSDGSHKKILLPIVPEYIGYADQGISENMFISFAPIIKKIDKHTFKYSIDFKNLKITKDIGAICISRPTNPSSNVVTDEEIEKLTDLAKKNNIPLIIDNAYGAPFPNIIFTKATPIYNENIIYVLTLSKLGLPTTRTSIVIASEKITAYLTSINAIVSLAPATLGQRLVLPFIKAGTIGKICEGHITPFYENRTKKLVEFFHSKMDPSLPYFLHQAEGAFFLWAYFQDLPISSMELYQKLKEKGVLVVPGEYFFPGFEGKLEHKDKCIRISYSQNFDNVKKGLSIIAETVKGIYAKA